MRHHTAAPLADESGWHYVSMGRSGGHPLGNCATHAPHPTEDDARRCYRQWQRDNVEPHGTWSWGSCHVRGCDNPARNGWHVKGDGYLLAIVCDDHNDRERAITALQLDGELVGDSWQS